MSAIVKAQKLTVMRGDKTVLHTVSFAVEANQLVGIIGPNGAGKSTLLATLAGLIAPQSGSVHIMGTALTTLTPGERARRLGYLPQHRPVHWAMHSEDIVMLGRYGWGTPGLRSSRAHPRDREKVDQAIAATKSDHLRTRALHTLSGGEQARVHLARALAGDTPLLLADEPTSALDPHHQFGVMHMLKTHTSTGKEGGRAVITAIHDLALAARYCDRLIILDQGALIAIGPPREVLTAQMMRDVFHATGSFVETPDGPVFITAPII